MATGDWSFACQMFKFSSPCSDWKQKKKKRSQAVALESYSGLAEVAIRCLCELLLALSHFNFHNNIIVAIAPLMNDANTKVRIPGGASLIATVVRWDALRCGFCVAGVQHVLRRLQEALQTGQSGRGLSCGRASHFGPRQDFELQHEARGRDAVLVRHNFGVGMWRVADC